MKPKLEFKVCPRCKGDLIGDRDIYGDYRQCLQCGHMEDIVRPSDFLLVSVARNPKWATWRA